MLTDHRTLTPYQFFRHCIHAETLGLHRPFTWGKVFRRYWRFRHIRYQIKWRFASYLFALGGKRRRKFAVWFNDRITEKHNVEIGLGAFIGPGLRIRHHNGIVITCILNAGANFTVSQNTTIGIKDSCHEGIIRIGDNVVIGANCCLISNGMTIGDNVTIGAHTFVNKHIPSNTTCFVRHTYTLIEQLPAKSVRSSKRRAAA